MTSRQGQGLLISDFLVPTSDFQVPNSDFQLPSSDFQLNTPDFFVLTSEIAIPEFDKDIHTHTHAQAPTDTCTHARTGERTYAGYTCIHKYI